MKLNSTQFSFLLALLFASTSMFAQVAEPFGIADQYVRANLEQWGLTTGDVQDMAVSDMYTDQKTGISRVYFNQKHNGILVHNAILNVNITKDGRVFYTGNQFVDRLAEKVNTTLPIISAEQALEKLATHLDLPYEKPVLLGQPAENEFVFAKGDIASKDIKVVLKYQKADDAVRLAWNVTLFPTKSSDMWDSRVDAVTGKILDETNWTVYCKVDGRSFKRDGQHDCSSHTHSFAKTDAAASMMMGAMYNIWPIPVESPIHGPREMVEDPHNLTASPYGWHDVNEVAGAEYTITRGNNVHAFQDIDGDGSSSNDEPDGGADLLFDFPYAPADEPAFYVEAATVNLFYMNNIMHDFSYHYGFDEAAGNFQANNYNGVGINGDHVNARAQAAGNNNASFGTPPDGENGVMSMFRWDVAGGAFRVDAPASVAGDDYPFIPPGGGWGDGAYVNDMTAVVNAEVAIANDGIFDPLASDACEDLINTSELEGKVVIIDRGGCEFGFKALQAQNAGAVGVIICNFEDALSGIGGAGAVGDQVEIPTIFMGVSDCQTIRQFAGNGLEVSFEEPMVVGPAQVDSDLDNGVIGHEYGHGISNRLTGGPSNVSCLGGDEQMGEGWSDFMSLITTAREGDTGDMPKGIGNYVDGKPINGGGIRHYPYTTDMGINPLTYSHIPNESVPHGVGAVWCTILWDMYWAFSDKYGFDPDLYEGTGGNNMAIQLVFDGMKNQPCGPGFVTGRDAILAADQALYNGDNQCLIWETFARRGVGVFADQGTTAAIGDETESFEVPCECRDKITISKSVNEYIDAGEDIDVTVTVTNCKSDPISDIKVTEQLADGTEFVPGSSNIDGVVQGSSVVFDIAAMPFGAEQEITYKLKSDPDNWSELLWLDAIESTDTEFEWEIGFSGSPSTIWTVTSQFGSHTGDYSWWVDDTDQENLVYFGQMEDKAFTVTGDRPALRFWHKYNTEPTHDGGWIEIKKVGEPNWTVVPDRMVRNGYTGALDYQTFTIPNLVGFSGSSGDDFIATYVDLSAWAGEAVQVRFRFGNDTGAEVLNGGWLIDDIEYQDMLSYNGEVCVTTAEGDNVCTIAPNEGTIVNSAEFNSTVEQLKDVTVTTYPNPVDDLLNIGIDSERPQDLEMSLLTLDGKTVSSQTFNLVGKQNVQVNVSSFPAGFYLLKVASEEGTAVRKIVIE